LSFAQVDTVELEGAERALNEALDILAHGDDGRLRMHPANPAGLSAAAAAGKADGETAYSMSLLLALSICFCHVSGMLSDFTPSQNTVEVTGLSEMPEVGGAGGT